MAITEQGKLVIGSFTEDGQLVIGNFTDTGERILGAVIEVATYADLKKVGTGVDGWNLDSVYIQTANIDASASETENWNVLDGVYNGFVPIGSSANPFTGTYDGGGYSITGLCINRPNSQSEGQALFSAISNALITDVHLIGSSTIAYSIASTLIARVYSNSTITKCSTIDFTIVCNWSAGGLLYIAPYGADYVTIEDCYAKGDITLINPYAESVGGFANVIYGSHSSVKRCFFSGNIDAGTDESSGDYTFSIGGFLGEVRCPTENCYAEGHISALYYSGGFTSWNTSTITNCYSACTIDWNQSNRVNPPADYDIFAFSGGGAGSITNCFYDSTLADTVTDTEATAKTTAEMKDISTFSSIWDITTYELHDTEVWFIKDDLDYPRLWYEWTDIIELSGGSDTTTRAELAIDVAITPVIDSTTNTRSDIELQSITSIFGKSSTFTRSDIKLTLIDTFSLRSITETRADIDLQSSIDISMKSDCDTRSDIELDLACRVSIKSSSLSRSDVVIKSGIMLLSSSDSTTRSDLTIDSSVNIFAVSATTTRSDILIVTKDSFALESHTTTRSDILLASFVELLLKSSTLTRADIVILSPLIISSRTLTRADIQIRTYRIMKVLNKNRLKHYSLRHYND